MRSKKCLSWSRAEFMFFDVRWIEVKNAVCNLESKLNNSYIYSISIPYTYWTDSSKNFTCFVKDLTIEALINKPILYCFLCSTKTNVFCCYKCWHSHSTDIVFKINSFFYFCLSSRKMVCTEHTEKERKKITGIKMKNISFMPSHLH